MGCWVWVPSGSPHPCSAAPNPFLAESPLLAAGSPRCAARGSQPALAQTSRVLLPPFPCSPALCWGCVCRGRALSSPVGTRCAPPCRHGALHEDVQVSPLCATLRWASSCCAAGGAGREGGGCACEAVLHVWRCRGSGRPNVCWEGVCLPTRYILEGFSCSSSRFLCLGDSAALCHVLWFHAWSREPRVCPPARRPRCREEHSRCRQLRLELCLSPLHSS